MLLCIKIFSKRKELACFFYLLSPHVNLNFSQLNLIFSIRIGVLGVWKPVKMHFTIFITPRCNRHTQEQTRLGWDYGSYSVTPLFGNASRAKYFSALNKNWRATLYKLRGTAWFDTCMYCEMTKELYVTPTTSQLQLSFLVMKTF